jgi:hypothetical protein
LPRQRASPPTIKQLFKYSLTKTLSFCQAKATMTIAIFRRRPN